MFGASLLDLGDLNGDEVHELEIGAPLAFRGEGCVRSPQSSPATVGAKIEFWLELHLDEYRQMV